MIDHPFNPRDNSTKCGQMYFDEEGNVQFCNKSPEDHLDYSTLDLVGDHQEGWIVD